MPRPSKLGSVEIDWSLSDYEIARRCGVNPATVWKWRRRLGLPARPVRDWRNVDWGLRDDVIAASLGVSPVTVRNRRLKAAREGLAKAGSPAVKPGFRRVVSKRSWSLVDWTLSDAEIAASLGIGAARVARRRRYEGKPLPDRWEGVDWSKSDFEIADALGVTWPTVRRRRALLNA